MSLSSIGLLLSGLLDVRQRFIRVVTGLEEALLAADGGTHAVLLATRGQLIERLRDHTSTVQGHVLTAQVSGGPDPSGWTEPLRTRLAAAGAVGFHRLTVQHLSLFRHLPRASRPRQDIQFLLSRALDLSLMSRTQARLISVSESDRLTWETTAFTDDQGVRTTAVAVPWGETLSPLRWPLVVHELGHYLLPGGADGFAEIERLSAEQGWSQDAFEEVVADAVATRYFGDAYPFALAREGYLLSYEKHAPNTLTVARRLKLIGRPEDLVASLPAEWKLDERESIDGNEQELITQEQAEAMRETASILVGNMPENRPDAVAEARVLLRAGEPCPGVRLSAVDTSIDDALTVVGGGGEIEDSASLLRLATHEALTDGEIYEAAWREETEKPLEEFVAALLEPLTSDIELGAEQKRLADFDTWLARSLQSAAVHRWLQLTGENQ